MIYKILFGSNLTFLLGLAASEIVSIKRIKDVSNVNNAKPTCDPPNIDNYGLSWYGEPLRVDGTKINFRLLASVLQQFNSKNFFNIPPARIKVIHPEFQMRTFPEILHFLTILDVAHVL